MATDQTQTNELFAKVFGYDEVKAELTRIKNWIFDEKYINNPKIMLPKGVLFYGRPGNGKTLMLREYAKCFKAPIYTVTGEGPNTSLSGEIINVFTKARKAKFAVVLIDEIDLLIAKDSRVERTLQQEMDGIVTKGSILVLATTNHIHDIDGALLRPGRFDRLIEISYPDLDSRKAMLKQFVSELNVSDENIDYAHAAKVCSNCSGAELKAVCNDAFLRCEGQINTDEIELSYDRVYNNNYFQKTENYKDFRVAIHEAGHVLMALAFNNNFTFYKATFNEKGGVTEVQEANEKNDTVDKRQQHIMISMGGYLAEEIYYKKHDVGSYSDYAKVQDQAQRLIERVCVKGINNLVPPAFYDEIRHWTSKRANKNEKLVTKIINKLEKQTRKYLSKHKQDLIHIATTMFEQGKYTYKDAKNNQISC